MTAGDGAAGNRRDRHGRRYNQRNGRAGPGAGGAGTTGGAGTGTGSTGTGKTTPPSNSLTEEGVLKEALTKLWERARSRKFTHIRTLELRLFDATDAFRLLGSVAAIQGATKQVVLTGSYETTDGGTLEIEFTGPPADAQPVKDFLDPQLRAAKDKTSPPASTSASTVPDSPSQATPRRSSPSA